MEMNKKSLPAQALLAAIAMIALIGIAFPSNVHMVSSTLDPSPHPYEDFDLVLTFKNDYDYTIENVMITLDCPAEFTCPNASRTFPSYGVQEIRFPIKSQAPAGIYLLNATWDDGSSRFVYNMNTDSSVSERVKFTSIIPIRVESNYFSNVSFTPNATYNRDNKFAIGYDAMDLTNAQVSLYSKCIAFEKPAFYFPRLDGNGTLETNGFVNCKDDTAMVSVTISSDQVSYTFPASVRIEKVPGANVNVELEEKDFQEGKDFASLSVSNKGAKAEKLTVSILSNSAVNAPDVLYLGDLEEGSSGVMQIETKSPGTFPVRIEAKWLEAGEEYTKVFNAQIRVVPRDDTMLKAGAAICILFLILIFVRK